MKLPDNASECDAGVVEGGLCAAERTWLEELRRALEAGRGDRSREPEDLVNDHAIEVVPAWWADYAEDLPFDTDTDDPQLLTRGDVTDTAGDCRSRRPWLPLLVTSFAWGWGKTGYGSRRLDRIMNADQTASETFRDDIDNRLSAAVEMLDREGAVAAYDLLLRNGRIRGLGPAFFTKFLYFASRASTEQCRALILDARLARQMRGFWERRADQPYAANGRPAEWLWRGPRWSAYRYQVYGAFMCRAAAQLSESGRRWTPELVELLLFRNDPGEALDQHCRQFD
ncbi:MULTISPECIES: hypothetical protein [unclassified Micromonospora]|uniref:8-oxoguanine DNA glycosylase OGG fold protein n=1 Tax=unclassified Micromonospora TaxID=2617518 RepID=UPI00332AAA0F